jgi:tRNA(Arg) A34 adenosine deaminase TadA
MCLGALYRARPSIIYYANSKQDAASINFDDQFIYDEISLPYAQRSIPCIQMDRDKAYKAFELWSQSNTKIDY